MHAGEQRESDHRAPGEHGVRILVVDLRLSGGGTDRILEPDDHAADTAAAFADLYLGIAGLGQPDPGGVAGRMARATRRSKEYRRARARRDAAMLRLFCQNAVFYSRGTFYKGFPLHHVFPPVADIIP